MTVPPTGPSARRTPAWDRLVAAANELFYAEGIHAVGVDRIIEHAGVSRASFYNNFDSKEQLIHAYLMARHQGTISRLSDAVGRHDDPRQKILAVFDTQAAQFRQPDFNGCPFAAASTGAPPGGTIESDAAGFRAILDPLVPLSRTIFEAPTRYYKTGVTFLAWLSGFQDRFVMIGGYQSARDAEHLRRLYSLAEQAGLFPDPGLAKERFDALA